MPWQMNYKGVIKKERNEECSNQKLLIDHITNENVTAG
jgi:hypothetical protein